MTDVVVAVRGEAEREVPPEIATCVVTAAARDRDRATVLRRLTERHQALHTLLDSYAEAIEKRETSGLTVYPETKGSGERVSSYQGRIGTSLTVTDFTVLGELLIRLADQDQVSVFGPHWALRPDSPAHREVRQAAVAAAVTRARDYAGALGAEVIGLELLADVGLGGNPGRAYAIATPRAASMPPDVDFGSGLDLQPQVQQLRAEVEARFRISTPTVLGTP
jgi:uncharacterized protein